jgi:excisionase family DNA binding protein
MEEITAVKISDLTQLSNQFSELLSEIKQLREIQEAVKAYTVQETAELLDIHHSTVRRLVTKGKLLCKYLEGNSGKYIIPYLAIKDYLKSTENTNQ